MCSFGQLSLTEKKTWKTCPMSTVSVSPVSNSLSLSRPLSRVCVSTEKVEEEKTAPGFFSSQQETEGSRILEVNWELLEAFCAVVDIFGPCSNQTGP